MKLATPSAQTPAGQESSFIFKETLCLPHLHSSGGGTKTKMVILAFVSSVAVEGREQKAERMRKHDVMKRRSRTSTKRKKTQRESTSKEERDEK